MSSELCKYLRIDFLALICYNGYMNRIDRIDGNNYYEYKVKNDKVPDADEKFSLEYNRGETPSAPDEKKEREKEISEQEKRRSTERSGVKLELSSRGQQVQTLSRQTSARTGEQAKTDFSSLAETIRAFFTAAVTAVKDFFYKIWNDPESGAGETADGQEAVKQEPDFQTALETAASIDAAPVVPEVESPEVVKARELRLDSEIQPYLKNGDLGQVISLLTDHGRKTAARNSTLLTYYDKNGRMVEPNASDRERILNGDRHTRKL